MILHKNMWTRLLALALAAIVCLPVLVACGDEPAVTTPQNDGGVTPGGDTSVGGTPKKRVALTFDDGPQHYQERTKEIVDELEKYGFHATFFVVGNRVAGGDALAYAVEKGNELGIHGYTHEVYYDTCTNSDYNTEINKTLAEIQKAVPGYKVRLMRPVGGRMTEEWIAASPYSVILWNVDSLDYEHTYKKGDSDEVAAEKVDVIVENVMSKVSDGDVILMHDIYESTFDAVVVLLAELDRQGYEVVTVSELFGDSLEPGKKYYNYN